MGLKFNLTCCGTHMHHLLLFLLIGCLWLTPSQLPFNLINLEAVSAQSFIQVRIDCLLHLHYFGKLLRMFSRREFLSCKWTQFEVEFVSQQLLGLLFQMRILLLENVLLAPQVEIYYNLFLQEFGHLIANSIRLSNLL